jgi:ribosome-associated protein
LKGGDERLRAVVAALEEHKARDVAVLAVEQVSILADYFVLCSGGSRNQVQALADAVVERVGGEARVEGYQEGRWVCLDLGPVVVHVFQDDVRAYFDLERLWGDAPRVDLPLRAAL